MTDPVTDMLRAMLAEATAKFPEQHFMFMHITPNEKGFETSVAANIHPKKLNDVLKEYTEQVEDDEVVYEKGMGN